MAKYCEMCGEKIRRNTKYVNGMALCKNCRGDVLDALEDPDPKDRRKTADAKEETMQLRAQREYARQTINASPWRTNVEDNPQYNHDVFIAFKRKYEQGV